MNLPESQQEIRDQWIEDEEHCNFIEVSQHTRTKIIYDKGYLACESMVAKNLIDYLVRAGITIDVIKEVMSKIFERENLKDLNYCQFLNKL